MITHLLTPQEREALERCRREGDCSQIVDLLILADALLRLCPEDDGEKVEDKVRELTAENEKLKALLQRVGNNWAIQSACDEGPEGHEWKSEELKQLWADIDAARRKWQEVDPL